MNAAAKSTPSARGTSFSGDGEAIQTGLPDYHALTWAMHVDDMMAHHGEVAY